MRINLFIFLFVACLFSCKNENSVTTKGSDSSSKSQAISRVEPNNIFLKDGSSIPLDFAEIDKVYYLVRHAEKVKDGSDNPILSVQGQDRALLLSDILWKGDLDRVFVTMTNRTIQTADTLVRIRNMNMITYDGKKLDEFAQKLSIDNSFKTALIVGHSNTTPTLAGLLSGTEFPKIPESGYDDLYVVMIRDGKAETHTLKYNR